MSRNIKIIIAVILLILVILGISRIIKKEPVTIATPIKVGIIGPFTGGLAEYGEAHKNGFMLAAEELGASNKNIQFIFEDSTYDAAKAVSAFRKLTEIDKVAVVVDWGAATAYGLAPLAKTAKVPFVAITNDPDVVKSNPYVIRHNYSADDIAAKLWEYFRQKGYKKIGLVKLNILYFNKISDSLQKLKNPDETVAIIDTYQSFDDRDFRTSVAKIKSNQSQYDTLGVFLAGGQIAQFYKQARAVGLVLPSFGTDFFESYTEIRDAAGTMEGAVYANYGASDKFVEKYKARFGNDNQISFAGLSYDLSSILLTKIDYSSPETILASLRAIKNYRGAIGTYSYSSEGGDSYLKPTLHLKEIKDNQIKLVR